jgi:hypothetical protein
MIFAESLIEFPSGVAVANLHESHTQLFIAESPFLTIPPNGGDNPAEIINSEKCEDFRE